MELKCQLYLYLEEKSNKSKGKKLKNNEYAKKRLC